MNDRYEVFVENGIIGIIDTYVTESIKLLYDDLYTAKEDCYYMNMYNQIELSSY